MAVTSSRVVRDPGEGLAGRTTLTGKSAEIGRRRCMAKAPPAKPLALHCFLCYNSAMTDTTHTPQPREDLIGGADRETGQSSRLAYEADRIAAAKASAAAGRIVDFRAVKLWAETIDTRDEASLPIPR
jgi:hypothetical protein